MSVVTPGSLKVHIIIIIKDLHSTLSNGTTDAIVFIPLLVVVAFLDGFEITQTAVHGILGIKSTDGFRTNIVTSRPYCVLLHCSCKNSGRSNATGTRTKKKKQ